MKSSAEWYEMTPVVSSYVAVTRPPDAEPTLSTNSWIVSAASTSTVKVVVSLPLVIENESTSLAPMVRPVALARVSDDECKPTVRPSSSYAPAVPLMSDVSTEKAELPPVRLVPLTRFEPLNVAPLAIWSIWLRRALKSACNASR